MKLFIRLGLVSLVASSLLAHSHSHKGDCEDGELKNMEKNMKQN